MAGVFLSYARDDAKLARPLALQLEKAGHSVWWDLHVRGGAQFSKVIEEALKAADVVVVLWSARAIESPWVRDEAGAGRDTGRLVPATVDGTEPPLGFRQFQTIDLSHWKGRARSAEFAELSAAIEAITSGSPETPAPQTAKLAPRRRWDMRPIAAGIAATAAVGGLIWWHPWSGRGGGPTTVAIVPADQAGQSRALARNLVLKLGEVQSTQAQQIRLSAEGEERADLRLEAAAPAEGHANLLLKDGRNGAILWSAEFERSPQEAADLAQQLALTSARVLDCDAQGRSSGSQLKLETLKSYLNVCAQLADLSDTDPNVPLRALRNIVQQTPRFKAGWAKLLVAESEAANQSIVSLDPDGGLIAALRTHIAQARKLDPEMPEAALAAMVLAEPGDVSRYLPIAEQAASRFSDNPEIMNFYSNALGRVGRLGDSVDAAEKAARLDPLSPAQQNHYIGALAYSGAFKPALRELQKAERLWPGTSSVRDAEFRFHYRYGDPKIARAIYNEQTSTDRRNAIVLYLDARENPSPANVQALLAYVRERFSNMESPSTALGVGLQVYAQFAGKEETLGLLLNWPKASDIAVMSDVLFRPHFRETRRDPRFMRVAQKIGLVRYWQKSGKWPDYCYEPGIPYDCKKEAAKLQ